MLSFDLKTWKEILRYVNDIVQLFVIYIFRLLVAQSQEDCDEDDEDADSDEVLSQSKICY